MRSLLLLTLVPLLLGACREQQATSDGFFGGRQGEGAPGVSPALPVADDVVTARVVYARLDGSEVTGFLARPPGATGPRGEGAPDVPAVLLIHEWWGLDEHVQSRARLLAESGYLALAVDLYEGRMAATAEEAQHLMGSAMRNDLRLENNLREAHRYLTEQERASRIGVVGWSFGGMWAFRLALLVPELDAVAVVYGHPVLEKDRLAALNAPLLALFGAQDSSIPLADVERLELTLGQLGKNATIEIVDGAGHGFAHPANPRHQPDAAEDAWRRIRAFLDHYVRRQTS
jgi:carboxymethylenebutenolidase